MLFPILLQPHTGPVPLQTAAPQQSLDAAPICGHTDSMEDVCSTKFSVVWLVPTCKLSIIADSGHKWEQTISREFFWKGVLFWGAYSWHQFPASITP